MSKIVLMVSRFPVISETFIVHKFLELIRQGWDVHVVCQKYEKSAENHFPEFKKNPKLRERVHGSVPSAKKWIAALWYPLTFFKLLFFSPQNTFPYLVKGFRRFRFGIFFRLYLDAEIIRLNPHIIHFEFGASAVNRTYLKDLLGSKLVVSFRGYDLNFSGLEDPNYYRDVWAEADRIHCLGEDLWRRAKNRGCPAEKPHVLIPPAIDTDLFKINGREIENVGKGERPVRILSVGRLDWKKGYEFSLQAIQQLKSQGVALEYRIIGSGNYLEAISYCRHQLHLENEVKLLGAQSQEKIREEMKWADIFLHAAVSEGFCNAVIEAQAMRLPVVSSDAGGLSENVQNGLTGYVVPRREPSELAEKLKVLTRNAERREEMGRRGHERALEKFKIQNQIKMFGLLYESLAT